MRPLALAKLVLAAAGLLVWGYGARAEVSVYQWTGVGLVFAAFALRFAERRPRPEPEARRDSDH